MKPPVVAAHRKRWSTKVRKAVWEKFGRACPTCKQPTDERGFELDHLIPLELGGEDAVGNLKPLCKPCHRIKTKLDVERIAKAKRREAKHRGFKAPPKGADPGQAEARASTEARQGRQEQAPAVAAAAALRAEPVDLDIFQVRLHNAMFLAAPLFAVELRTCVR